MEAKGFVVLPGEAPVLLVERRDPHEAVNALRSLLANE